MDPHDPIPWDRLETVRSEPRFREVFDAHSEEVTDRATFQEAVDHLKELVRGDPDIPAPDQGVAFVFAYLLERETAWDITEAFSTTEIGTAPSLLDRRPDASTLERLFWEERRVPWWWPSRWECTTR